MRTLSLTSHCLIGFYARVLFIIYANFHDQFFQVPYTDVDYKVFTDAARFVTEGKSPFERHTYRYSPLLAWLLTLNIYIHPDIGKFLFSLTDVFVSLLIWNILRRQKCPAPKARLCSFLWLYNPLTIIISTRGNADSISAFFVLSTLLLLKKDNYCLAGLMHGLSIHFRLYPLMFSFSIYLYLKRNNRFWPNKEQLLLVFSCLTWLAFFTAIGYYFYGYQFLYESVIYHLVRKDTRHNFSVYFYMLYLSSSFGPNLVERVMVFLPQFLLLVALSFSFSSKRALAMAMLTQAMVMVMYNPIMTSQYFYWFLSLLPVCLPSIKMSLTRSVMLLLLWLGAQGFWLFSAYFLEFQGVNLFKSLWLAGILFFLANIKVFADVCRAVDYKIMK